MVSHPQKDGEIMMRKGMAVKAMGHFGAERGTFFGGKCGSIPLKKRLLFSM